MINEKYDSIFVSDIHLTDTEDTRYILFIKLLTRLGETPPKRLILLGDIFDLWVSDHKYFLDKHKELLGLLETVKKSGVEIHYFEGNHDLYLSDYFENKLGFIVHPSDFSAVWNGVKIRMEHGDLANPDDKGYLFLRAFLRTASVRWSLSSLPGRFIKFLGERASSASRKYTDQIDVDSKQCIRSYAEKLATESDFDVLITGHTHQKDNYLFFDSKKNQRRSINLGSWFSPSIEVLTQKGEKLSFTQIS